MKDGTEQEKSGRGQTSGMRQLCKLDTARELGMWEDMGGDTRGWILVYVQVMHRGGGFGRRSGRSEADGGRHEGDGCRTAS